MKDKIDIFFVGGGTAGHVLPNIFIINEVLSRKPDLKIAYIGSKNSIEKKIFEENFSDKKYFEISSDKLRRYLTYKHIFAPFKIIKGFFDSLVILTKYRPKLIFAKGGFVCAPVIFAAKFLGIKIFIHESDYSIGLTNKISMPFASKIGVSFQKTIENSRKFQAKMKLFGPIFNKKILNLEDESVLHFSKKIQNWQMHYKENGEKKILLIIGGSLGSKIINDLIYENYKILLRDFKIIHVCGKGNLDYEIQKFCKNQENDYEVFETLSHEDLIKLIKISEIVISRAGINSVFELMFFKKLSIFIPLSKKNSRGDQIENAEYFFSKGGCEMIREENLNFLTLLQKLKIFVSKESAHIFRNNLEKIEINLGTDEISEEILNMIS